MTRPALLRASRAPQAWRWRIGRAAILGATLVAALSARDAVEPSRASDTPRASPHTMASIEVSSRGRCHAPSEALPSVLFYELRAGAFAGSNRPDVAVHVPPGFEADRRPGLVAYFHGWQGCVASALASEAAPCSEGGPVRDASDLTTPMDEAHVNALLVAVETRADAPTGEPGQLARPGGFRDLLRELFVERLAGPLGCTVDVDGLDRVVLVAHSGGYQAAASVLRFGDVPRITEVDLLDSLYGADAVFARWIESQLGRFDSRASDPLRFVDLYTCCGGTAEPSRALATRARSALGSAGLANALVEDVEPSPATLPADGIEGNVGESPNELSSGHAIVFREVHEPHGLLPRAYLRNLVETAGFRRIRAHTGRTGSYPIRPN